MSQITLKDLEIEAELSNSKENKAAIIPELPNTKLHIQLPGASNKKTNYYDVYYLILSTMADLHDKKEPASMNHTLELAGLHRNSTCFTVYKELYCNGLVDIAVDDSDNYRTRAKALRRRGPKV